MCGCARRLQWNAGFENQPPDETVSLKLSKAANDAADMAPVRSIRNVARLIPVTCGLGLHKILQYYSRRSEWRERGADLTWIIDVVQRNPRHACHPILEKGVGRRSVMTCDILFWRGEKPHAALKKCIEQSRVSFAPKHPAAIYTEARFINPGLPKCVPGTDPLVEFVVIDQDWRKTCLACTGELQGEFRLHGPGTKRVGAENRVGQHHASLSVRYPKEHGRRDGRAPFRLNS